MKQRQFSDQDFESSAGQSESDEDLCVCPDQVSYTVICRDKTLHVQQGNDERSTIWRLYTQSGQLKLEWAVDWRVNQPQVTELLAAIEAAFTYFPHEKILYLSASTQSFDENLFTSGVLVRTTQDQIVVYAELFWQQARLWLSSIRSQAFPLMYVFSQGRRHPLRPPKPQGMVYSRYITWLGATLTFRTIDMTADLEHFNRWMNEPDVVAFWQEAGDLAKHRKYLEEIHSDTHMINLMACLDDKPFGYFEIYWAKEDRIAPYYDVDDYDRGWHVLIGEPHMRGKRFVTAWLPSISHYLFLDDDRTQRIVIEPRADNHKMIRNLTRSGYANLKEFDFPHKRAMLGMLSRERFFSEQLWVPQDPLTPSLVS